MKHYHYNIHIQHKSFNVICTLYVNSVWTHYDFYDLEFNCNIMSWYLNYIIVYIFLFV
jgi:hypothetical protein